MFHVWASVTPGLRWAVCSTVKPATSVRMLSVVSIFCSWRWLARYWRWLRLSGCELSVMPVCNNMLDWQPQCLLTDQGLALIFAMETNTSSVGQIQVSVVQVRHWRVLNTRQTLSWVETGIRDRKQSRKGFTTAAWLVWVQSVKILHSVWTKLSNIKPS